MHADNLKAAIMNVGEYRAVLAALKASQPTKAELAAIVEELTGIKAASSATAQANAAMKPARKSPAASCRPDGGAPRPPSLRLLANKDRLRPVRNL